MPTNERKRLNKLLSKSKNQPLTLTDLTPREQTQFLEYLDSGEMGTYIKEWKGWWESPVSLIVTEVISKEQIDKVKIIDLNILEMHMREEIVDQEEENNSDSSEEEEIFEDEEYNDELEKEEREESKPAVIKEGGRENEVLNAYDEKRSQCIQVRYAGIPSFASISKHLPPSALKYHLLSLM